MKQEEPVKQIDGQNLTVIPLGGQSELGQVLWVISYQGKMIIIDAGAAYPNRDLPGVDLQLPNTSFLEANQSQIEALLLTSGNEEYIGAVPYLLKHVNISKIMAPEFISCLLEQTKSNLPADHPLHNTKIENVETKQVYSLGPFEVEWIRVNDAVAQACALRIATPEHEIIYMTTYKLDQTPADHQLTDIARFAQLGEDGVTLLIGSSAGVERTGYSESELVLYERLHSCIKDALGRVIVLMSGTNTYRLQNLIDIAKQCDRKILLLGDPLVHCAVASTLTGNLAYQQELEVSLNDLSKMADNRLLIVATGKEGNPMPTLTELANGTHKFLRAKASDTIIYSSNIPPGRLRQMAMLLDQFLLLGIKVYWGEEQGVHVPRSAGQEELKLALSLIKPKYFLPAFGEGRHIMHHAKLAEEWGMPQSDIFPLQNGQIFSIVNGAAVLKGRTEYQAVLVNREHGERITTFTVNERRAMSLEGLITISLIIDNNRGLVSGPNFGCSAASFRYSIQWKDACVEMTKNITEALEKQLNEKQGQHGKIDEVAIRAVVRDTAFKTLRAHLQTKPVLQIVIQQLDAVKK
jgi:ribonuclease J